MTTRDGRDTGQVTGPTGHVLVSGRDRAEVQRTLADVRGLVRLDYDQATDVAPFDVT